MYTRAVTCACVQIIVAQLPYTEVSGRMEHIRLREEMHKLRSSLVLGPSLLIRTPSQWGWRSLPQSRELAAVQSSDVISLAWPGLHFPTAYSECRHACVGACAELYKLTHNGHTINKI